MHGSMESRHSAQERVGSCPVYLQVQSASCALAFLANGEFASLMKLLVWPEQFN